MATNSSPIGVLFVCLGNICRSPLAEGVFRRQVAEAGLAGRFRIESAGTSDYHMGEPPDRRTAETARRRGLVLKGTARQITPTDAATFDYILAMDAQNLRGVRRIAQAGGARVARLRDYDPLAGGDLDVPDPYFGGADGFEAVHDMIERSCAALLSAIRAEHDL